MCVPCLECKSSRKALKWEAFWAEHTLDEWEIYKDAIKKRRLKFCSKVSNDVIVAYDELYKRWRTLRINVFRNMIDVWKYVLQGLKLINW